MPMNNKDFCLLMFALTIVAVVVIGFIHYFKG